MPLCISMRKKTNIASDKPEEIKQFFNTYVLLIKLSFNISGIKHREVLLTSPNYFFSCPKTVTKTNDQWWTGYHCCLILKNRKHICICLTPSMCINAVFSSPVRVLLKHILTLIDRLGVKVVERQSQLF